MKAGVAILLTWPQLLALKKYECKTWTLGAFPSMKKIAKAFNIQCATMSWVLKKGVEKYDCKT
jgi:hypothetical protein